jgi:hypothetical protein
MRRVNINPTNVLASLNEIGRASAENDLVDISQAFTLSGTLTPTYVLNLTSPTAANIAAVLGTLILAMQKGGINRTT